MNLADMSNILGAFVGFVLTLLIMSYLLGDNPLFRLAIHIFIGATAGYLAIMVLYGVILPRLIYPLVYGVSFERVMALVLLVLSLMLLSKISMRLSFAGSLVVAFLVGVGAAAAIGGAVTGTLFPQMEATMNGFNVDAILTSGKSLGLELLNGLIVLVGTVSTLIYFQFSTRTKAGMNASQPIWVRAIARLGQGFIAITLGALFAGVYAAALVALIERLNAIIQFIISFIWPIS
jgi:hypothetical protein